MPKTDFFLNSLLLLLFFFFLFLPAFSAAADKNSSSADDDDENDDDGGKEKGKEDEEQQKQISSTWRWLRRLRGERVALFQDIGSVGLVSLDALVFHVLTSDPLLNVAHGGQPAHLCFKALRFLTRLAASSTSSGLNLVLSISSFFFGDNPAPKKEIKIKIKNTKNLK